MSNIFLCPVCGEEVKAKAKVCPGCGADEKTGLKQDYLQNEFVYDGLDLPDDEFDYEAYVEREFGGKTKKSKKEWIVASVALIVVVIWVFMYVF